MYLTGFTSFAIFGFLLRALLYLNAISVIARNISIDRLILYLVELDVMPLPRLLQNLFKKSA
jgi:hypothetical protein